MIPFKVTNSENFVNHILLFIICSMPIYLLSVYWFKCSFWDIQKWKCAQCFFLSFALLFNTIFFPFILIAAHICSLLVLYYWIFFIVWIYHNFYAFSFQFFIGPSICMIIHTSGLLGFRLYTFSMIPDNTKLFSIQKYPDTNSRIFCTSRTTNIYFSFSILLLSYFVKFKKFHQSGTFKWMFNCLIVFPYKSHSCEFSYTLNLLPVKMIGKKKKHLQGLE